MIKKTRDGNVFIIFIKKIHTKKKEKTSPFSQKKMLKIF